MIGARWALAIALVLAATAHADPPRTTVAGSVDMVEQASSPAVRTNHGRLFTKISDNGLYYLSDAGAESNLLTGGASASAILASLLTVDGAGSLLDADFLDGISSGGFCLTDGTRVYTGNISFEGATVNAFKTSFAIVDPTASRTITFKDGSGTVAFLTDITNMSAADILAALITVDGAGSLLDADFLDGQSSAAFAVVAGGNTFAASNNYVANDITDADVSDTLTCSLFSGSGSTTTAVDLATAEVAGVLPDANVVDTITASSYLPLAGGTMTGGVTSSGVATDVTTGTNEDYTISPNGTGTIRATSTTTTSVIRLANSNSSNVKVVSTATNAFFGNENDGGGISIIGGVPHVGPVSFSPTSTQRTLCGSFNVGVNNADAVVCIYGLGAIGVVVQQSITISTGLDTTSPTSSQVELTCTTPACSYSPGETSVIDGWQIEVCNVDTADNISLATAANVVVVRGSPLVLTPGECSACTYTGAIWGCH